MNMGGPQTGEGNPKIERKKFEGEVDEWFRAQTLRDGRKPGEKEGRGGDSL